MRPRIDEDDFSNVESGFNYQAFQDEVSESKANTSRRNNPHTFYKRPVRYFKTKAFMSFGLSIAATCAFLSLVRDKQYTGYAVIIFFCSNFLFNLIIQRGAELFEREPEDVSRVVYPRVSIAMTEM